MTKKHTIARRFEHQLAEDLGGRRLFASGAGFEKADVRRRQGYKQSTEGIVPTDEVPLRIEAKTTSKGAYTFRVQDWVDVSNAAMYHGEEPVFAIYFVGARYACILITYDFAVRLGMKKADDTPLPQRVEKSWSITYLNIVNQKQRTVISCTIRNKEECLVLVPYTNFLKAINELSSDR
jgi:hypothetical protein